MNLLKIIALSAVIWPLTANAGDNSCYQQVRDQVIAGRAIFATAPWFFLSNDLKNASPRVVQFSETRDSAGNVSLAYQYWLFTAGWKEKIEYTFSLPDKFAQSVLKVEVNTKFFQKGKLILDQTDTVMFGGDCKASYSANENIIYQEYAGKVHLIKNIRGTGRATSQLEGDMTPAEYATETDLNASLNVRSLFKSRFLNAPAFTVVSLDQTGLQHTKIRLSSTKPVNHLNTISGKREPMKGIAMQIEGVKNPIFYYSGSQGYNFSVSNWGETNSVVEARPMRKWLQLAPARSTDSDPLKVSGGFSDEDFSRDDLRITINGHGDAPKPDLLTHYFSVVSTSSTNTAWSETLAVLPFTPPVNIVSWNAPVSPADHKYLQGSQYIQIDKTQGLKEEALSKLTTQNRLQAAKTIIEIVDSHMQYDYDALNSGLVDSRTSTDVLQNGKGVCQHFALVFVTVARSVGIPVRIMNGFLLYTNKAQSHSWIEVKLNDTDWWPIDPQIAGETLAYHRYVPVAESFIYETPAGAEFAQTVDAFLAEMHAWKPWDSAEITKLR